MLNIYISGALTGIEELVEIKAFYEAIGALCKKIEMQAYVPHLNTDPINHPNVTPRQVFELDKYQVSQSDLVIAYIGFASLGVGMELAYADTNSTPIVLLYEKNKHISRFPRGIPSTISEIQFIDYEDALMQLKIVLEEWKVQQLKQLTPPYSA
ncbi:MAG: nucleoside 2-deoxyribosyltransferase [Chroococcus sp. CMT-3BRIN-NPC107]|jgi:nucleoside 2-deoxyribosyltransferase|nr:nucleoside 2-deoxyribosyltransferase [Chroococcus sp. CMT-3BRIN-NPC107]